MVLYRPQIWVNELKEPVFVCMILALAECPGAAYYEMRGRKHDYFERVVLMALKPCS